MPERMVAINTNTEYVKMSIQELIILVKQGGRVAKYAERALRVKSKETNK